MTERKYSSIDSPYILSRIASTPFEEREIIDTLVQLHDWIRNPPTSAGSARAYGAYKRKYHDAWVALLREHSEDAYQAWVEGEARATQERQEGLLSEARKKQAREESELEDWLAAEGLPPGSDREMLPVVRLLESVEVEACADIARAHMTGTRDGSDRSSWRHAQDVAECVEDLDVILLSQELRFWKGVGWLHDVLEENRALAATDLTEALVERGVDRERATSLVSMVQLLTKEEGEVDSYFARIRDAGIWQLNYIKIADRIVNLQEGKGVFPRKRWSRYVEETKAHMLPLLENLPDGIRGKLFFVLAMSMFRTKRRGPRQRKNTSPNASS